MVFLKWRVFGRGAETGNDNRIATAKARWNLLEKQQGDYRNR